MDPVCTMMEFLERWRNRPPDGYDSMQLRSDLPTREDFERPLVDLDRELQEEWNEHWLRVAFDIWKDEICPPLTVDE